MTAQMQKLVQNIPVYVADDLSVVHGVNLGDAISFADELVLDDTYELSTNARTYPISLITDPLGNLTIAPDSELGQAGALVHLDSCLTMMSANGQTTETLILIEVDPQGNVANVFARPLALMSARTGYSLVDIDRNTARQRFAEVACVSFTRGTHITMATGHQCRIEDLQVGDKVLTRDDSVQELRWIGQNTTRAVGDFAPVLIRAGTLHNENDLLVSPDHRLFIYQRSDTLGARRSEVLIRARMLVNGDSVVRQTGGFVDYFQLLFDHHQIVYAEGIAAETLLFDTRTRGALPDDMTGKLSQSSPGHAPRPHMNFDVDDALLENLDVAELLRRASTS